MLSTDNKIHDGFLEIEIEQFLFYTKKKKTKKTKRFIRIDDDRGENDLDRNILNNLGGGRSPQ